MSMESPPAHGDLSQSPSHPIPMGIPTPTAACYLLNLMTAIIDYSISIFQNIVQSLNRHITVSVNQPLILRVMMFQRFHTQTRK